MRENGKWTDDDWVSSMSEIDRPSILSESFEKTSHLPDRIESSYEVNK